MYEFAVTSNVDKKYINISILFVTSKKVRRLDRKYIFFTLFRRAYQQEK